MLINYKGPSNSHEVFQHLVGETIVAAFLDDSGKVFLVTASGPALVLSSPDGRPSYWTESADTVKGIVADRRAQIDRKLAELRDMAGVAL